MENTQYRSQTPQPAPEAAMPKTAMGITSLVLGIIAIASSWMPIVNNLSALLALLGGIFGVIGVIAVIRGKKSGKVLAIVGLVLNVVALVVVLATQSMYSAAIDDAMSGSAATSASASSEARLQTKRARRRPMLRLRNRASRRPRSSLPNLRFLGNINPPWRRRRAIPT